MAFLTYRFSLRHFVRSKDMHRLADGGFRVEVPRQMVIQGSALTMHSEATAVAGVLYEGEDLVMIWAEPVREIEVWFGDICLYGICDRS